MSDGSVRPMDTVNRVVPSSDRYKRKTYTNLTFSFILVATQLTTSRENCASSEFHSSKKPHFCSLQQAPGRRLRRGLELVDLARRHQVRPLRHQPHHHRKASLCHRRRTRSRRSGYSGLRSSFKICRGFHFCKPISVKMGRRRD